LTKLTHEKKSQLISALGAPRIVSLR